jgi:hypothetical protein
MQFEERARFQFDRELAAFNAATLRLAKELGWKQSLNKRATVRHAWLVLWQIEGLSAARILGSLREHTDVSSVEHAVKRTAQTLGLTLRPPRKGHGPRPTHSLN